MAKRSSDEEKVVSYFQDRPIEAAQATFNICKGVMKRRDKESPSATKTVNKPRPTRTAPATQSSLAHDDMARRESL